MITIFIFSNTQSMENNICHEIEISSNKKLNPELSKIFSTESKKQILLDIYPINISKEIKLTKDGSYKCVIHYSYKSLYSTFLKPRLSDVDNKKDIKHVFLVIDGYEKNNNADLNKKDLTEQSEVFFIKYLKNALSNNNDNLNNEYQIKTKTQFANVSFVAKNESLNTLKEDLFSIINNNIPISIIKEGSLKEDISTFFNDTKNLFYNVKNTNLFQTNYINPTDFCIVCEIIMNEFKLKNPVELTYFIPKNFKIKKDIKNKLNPDYLIKKLNYTDYTIPFNNEDEFKINNEESTLITLYPNKYLDVYSKQNLQEDKKMENFYHSYNKTKEDSIEEIGFYLKIDNIKETVKLMFESTSTKNNTQLCFIKGNI